MIHDVTIFDRYKTVFSVNLCHAHKQITFEIYEDDKTCCAYLSIAQLRSLLPVLIDGYAALLTGEAKPDSSTEESAQ